MNSIGLIFPNCDDLMALVAINDGDQVSGTAKIRPEALRIFFGMPFDKGGVERGGVDMFLFEDVQFP